MLRDQLKSHSCRKMISRTSEKNMELLKPSLKQAELPTAKKKTTTWCPTGNVRALRSNILRQNWHLRAVFVIYLSLDIRRILGREIGEDCAEGIKWMKMLECSE